MDPLFVDSIVQQKFLDRTIPLAPTSVESLDLATNLSGSLSLENPPAQNPEGDSPLD
jgi:hypothetical protein